MFVIMVLALLTCGFFAGIIASIVLGVGWVQSQDRELTRESVGDYLMKIGCVIKNKTNAPSNLSKIG